MKFSILQREKQILFEINEKKEQLIFCIKHAHELR